MVVEQLNSLVGTVSLSGTSGGHQESTDISNISTREDVVSVRASILVPKRDSLSVNNWGGGRPVNSSHEVSKLSVWRTETQNVVSLGISHQQREIPVVTGTNVSKVVSLIGVFGLKIS